MTDDITTKAGFFARSRKAFAAGLAGASAALVPSLTAALSDGVFDWNTEFWPVLTATLGFGLIAFAGVYRVPNAE